MYNFLADVIVLVHLAFVSFVVVGQLLILVGILLRWQWIRNAWFRCVHLLSILFVAFEYVFGITCPLTDLEYYLRGLDGTTTEDAEFMVRLLRELMFYPPETAPILIICACVFAGLVVLTFIIAPPRFRRRKAAAASAIAAEPARLDV